MCDEKAMRDIFDQFDNDKSGTIDQKELKTVLKAYFEAVGEASDDERVEQAATLSTETALLSRRKGLLDQEVIPFNRCSPIEAVMAVHDILRDVTSAVKDCMISLYELCVNGPFYCFIVKQISGPSGRLKSLKHVLKMFQSQPANLL